MINIRNKTIDALRGIAMLVMIVTHTTVFFPSDPIAAPLWNWLHFAVPIFLFCSAYLFFHRYKDTPPHFWRYLKKRFLRLLVPYYLFLLVFLPLIFFLKPETLNLHYLLGSIFLFAGVDINWLVLLFLMITILLPFIVFSWKHSRILFWGLFFFSLASSIDLLFFGTPLSYRLVMWLPWSLVLYVTFFYVHNEENKKSLGMITILAFSIFIISYMIQHALGHTTIFIHNKYPPNIFYLSYGIFLLMIFSIVLRYTRYSRKIMTIFHFFSRYSYQLYFIHYVVLTILAASLPSLSWHWTTFTAAVLGVTIFFQYILIIFIRRFSKKQ